MQHNKNISQIRTDYTLHNLIENQITPNPMDFFDIWWKDAIDNNPIEVNSFTLSTVDEQGGPHSRILLLKGYDERGFIFYTNYESDKGKQIAKNNKVSLLFFWMSMQRQVRIEGRIEKISRKESESYFSERPRESQIGAWASKQSAIISDRRVLEEESNKYIQEFQGIDKIPCPEYWGGYVVKPYLMEFWQGRPNRLHDRICYIFENNIWKTKRLNP